MVRYIIRDLVSNGYWTTKYNNFKGIIFASQYLRRKDAEEVIKYDIPSGTYEIIKIYR